MKIYTKLNQTNVNIRPHTNSFLTLLHSHLAEFNLPNNDIISRGGAEENRAASFSKSHGAYLTMVPR